MGLDTELVRRLESLRGARTVVLGVGNDLKGDDAAGPLVCRRIEGGAGANVMDAGTVPENYIQRIVRARPEHLVIIDAADFGDEAGAARLFEVEELSGVAMSTHSLSPRLFVDLIRRQIEVGVVFVGIQPGQMELGRGLSADVEAVVGELAEVLSRSL